MSVIQWLAYAIHILFVANNFLGASMVFLFPRQLVKGLSIHLFHPHKEKTDWQSFPVKGVWVGKHMGWMILKPRLKTADLSLTNVNLNLATLKPYRHSILRLKDGQAFCSYKRHFSRTAILLLTVIPVIADIRLSILIGGIIADCLLFGRYANHSKYVAESA